MTTTPKSVIMTIVVIIGLVVVSVVIADAALLATGNPTLPSQIETLAPVGLAGVIGLLASTRTTPELAPGQQLSTAGTTLTGPPDPNAAPASAPVYNVTVQPTTDVAAGTSLEEAAQTMEHADPSTIPGYSQPVPDAPPVTKARHTEPIVSADQPPAS